MTTFENGPAQGKSLLLKRAPKFLRVVEELGKWDALDQVDDTPGRNEKLFAYMLTCEPGQCHLNFGRGRGGWYVMATYRLVAEQPGDAEMRDFNAWRQWCERNAALAKDLPGQPPAVSPAERAQPNRYP